MNIADFFMPDGVWRAEYASASTEQLRACLRDPWNALKPVWDVACRDRLSREGGVEFSELRDGARNGIDSILAEEMRAGRIDSYEAAVTRLVVESLLVAKTGDIFPQGDEKTRRNWIEGMDPRRTPGRPPTFAAIKGLSPERMLRLAVMDRSLRVSRNIGVRTSGAVAQVVVGALQRVIGTQPIPVEAKIRLAVLRYWILTQEHEHDDIERSPLELLKAAGLTQTQLLAIIDDLRNERGITRLIATDGREVDLSSLLGFPRFVESAEFYGFSFDPRTFVLLRELSAETSELTDPWVRLLYAVALGSGPVASATLAEIERLGPERRMRERAFDFLLMRGQDIGRDISAILERELVPQGTGLYQRIFRALAEARCFGSWNTAQLGASEAGLLEWFESCWTAYRRHPMGACAPHPEDPIIAGAGRSVSTWRRSQPLGEFADAVLAESRQVERRLERSEADEEGRAWMYDLVTECEGKQPEDWDRRREILLGEDQAALRRMLQARSRGSPRWWSDRIDRLQELRLREVAVLIRRAEPEILERMVREHADEMRGLCSGVPDDVLTTQLDLCVEDVLDGTSSSRSLLLRAFRRGDAADFRELLDPPHVELPPKRRERGVIGKRVVIYGFALAAIGVTVLLRVFFIGATSEASVSPSGPPLVRVSSDAALDPRTRNWERIGSEGRWCTSTSSAEIQRLMGVDLLPAGMGSRAQLDFELADEYVRRLQRNLEANYPAGLRVDQQTLIPWERLMVRLPLKDDHPNALFAGGAAGDELVWLGDGNTMDGKGVVQKPSFDQSGHAKAYANVVIEVRR